MPSDNSPRLQRIDETHLADHYNLNADDECYFFFEYTSGKSYEFSATNNLISNLKKSPLKKGKGEYAYKGREIAKCAALFGKAIRQDWMKIATLVPVPPSKAKDHPEYDDRMRWICQNISGGAPVDVREIVVQTASTEAFHITNQRPSVEDLLAVYAVDEGACSPDPNAIGVFDDVLTVGTHYRAMHALLSARFPKVPIVGFFIARRIFPPMPEL